MQKIADKKQKIAHKMREISLKMQKNLLMQEIYIDRTGKWLLSLELLKICMLSAVSPAFSLQKFQTLHSCVNVHLH